MRTTLALVLLPALCAICGCGSSHGVVVRAGAKPIPISQLPKITGCTEITFSDRTHKMKARPVPCTGYHPVPAHKK
jgi:hypothetical protein